MIDSKTPSDSSKHQLTRATLLLRHLQSALQARLGKSPTYADMAEWTGASEATVKDWYNNRGRPSAEFLLQLFDRVSDELRNEIIRKRSRIYPTLDHPWLKCDRTVSSLLRTIILQTNGMSIIRGEPDESRTFLITALGNAFLSLTERPHRVVGIDAHAADWFVPVPGVRYLDNLTQPARLKEIVQQAWTELRSNRPELKQPQLLLLNGIGSVIPDSQNEITAMAAGCHVIFSDSQILKISRRGKLAGIPINLIMVSGNPENIIVEVRAL